VTHPSPPGPGPTPLPSGAAPLDGVRADVQSLIATGHGKLQQGRYALLHLPQGQDAGARAWLRALLGSGRVRDAQPPPHGSAPAEAVFVAFTHAGLRRLGERETAQAPFPTVFAQGMGHPDRRAMLGDAEDEAWDWADTPDAGAGFVAHVLVGQFWDAGHTPSDPLAPGACWPGAVRWVRTCPRHLTIDRQSGRVVATEPFGFRDGVVQPRLEWGSPRATERLDDPVPAGEFVLGLRNAFGEHAYSPDLESWSRRDGAARFGMQGSYLAVRQIEQDVGAWQRLVATLPGIGPKLMGRFEDGRSLQRWPAVPDPDASTRLRRHDALGLQCPRGAHTRRAHPRDTLGPDEAGGRRAAALHRLLRRGRVYCETGAEAGDEPGLACRGCTVGEPRLADADAAGVGAAGTSALQRRTGLFFIAANADLERQFEFVQGRWIANRRFGDLADEDDPLLGRSGRFTIPDQPVGRTHEGLQRLTRLRGGGYFFLPGLAALRFLATPPAGR
jgi:porphyrinogen peroxidase